MVTVVRFVVPHRAPPLSECLQLILREKTHASGYVSHDIM